MSVSYNRIGDMQAAQGQGADALTAYRQSLAIREHLAQQDPSNAIWQTDLVVSYWKLSQVKAKAPEDSVAPRALLERGLAILYQLRDASRLSTKYDGWITTFEHALQSPPAARGMRRLLTRMRAWWRGAGRESA